MNLARPVYAVYLHENDRYYAYATGNGGYFYRDTHGRTIGSLQAFFIGLPSVWHHSDASGNLVAYSGGCDTFAYDAYGQRVDPLKESINEGLLYAGEQFDTHLQMYYNRARYYDQNNGRFNRMDPFAGGNQDPQSLHKYLYCHANPVNNIDPSGQFTLPQFVFVVAILAILGTILWMNISQRRATRVITGGLGALEFAENDLVQLVNGMQHATLRLPHVVNNYNSNNWDEWFENCVDAEVYTIGIYGYGAVGEGLTPGQYNIVNYFEDSAWFGEHADIWSLYPSRYGEPGYELLQGYAEMVRMNAAIAECRDFAHDQGYINRIDPWEEPDPWEEIYGAP